MIVILLVGGEAGSPENVVVFSSRMELEPYNEQKALALQ
jgi:hypothetical protein